MEGTGTEFSVMNIDEFLNENNFDFDNFSRNVPEDERDQGMAMPPNGGNSYRYHKCNMFAFVSISMKFDLDELIAKSYLFKHVYRNPNSVSSEDGMMETEQPISPPVQVVMPQSPSRNDYCLKRKADFDSNQSQLTNISQWNKSKNDGPKVRITF